MSASVYGLASSETRAKAAIKALEKAGFRLDDVSVLFPDKAGTRDFAVENSTKAPEGAVAGGTTGVVVGGTLGWLVGIGMLVIPGVGPFIAAGPILASLSGMAVGAAVGSLTGSLIGLGIPEYEAKRYEGKIREGGILISVHADNGEWATKAKTILKEAGIDDISSSGEASAQTKSAVGDQSSMGNKNATTKRASGGK